MVVRGTVPNLRFDLAPTDVGVDVDEFILYLICQSFKLMTSCMVTNRVAGGLDLQLKHDDGWNIPASNPFYPPLPAFYRNVRFQFVFFHAAPDAVQDFLPEPLQAAEDGLCVASGLEVPYCENYGPFQESFIVMKCHFRDQTGFYCSHVFHNGPAGIAAGREIYGTPKMYAEMKVTHVDQRMVTETSYGGVRVLKISTRMETGRSPRRDARPYPGLALEDHPPGRRSGTGDKTADRLHRNSPGRRRARLLEGKGHCRPRGRSAV